MPGTDDFHELSGYFIACEAYAEARFDDLPAERRDRIATWSAALMATLQDENIPMSDIQMMLGTLAGMIFHGETIPDGLSKAKLRSHRRNMLIGSFERGCDGISVLDRNR
jgi:hypothetical protein